MRVDVLTIFPHLFESPFKEGIIARAVQDGKVKIIVHNIRDYTTDKHSMTDDRPFGGGEGMLMKPEPIARALAHVQDQAPGGRVFLLSPQGRLFSQTVAEELAHLDSLILLCGRYEGVDERIRIGFVDEEISIGDYILTGGELAAMVLIDAVIRLIPGVLRCPDSAENDTFSRGLLKYPQYTRPRIFDGVEVPEVLLSGDHKAIAEWRFAASVRQTLLRRPNLIFLSNFTESEMKILKKYGVADELSKSRQKRCKSD